MNCTKLDSIDDSNSSAEMLLLGLYIAGAILLCITATVRDLVISLKSKQFWMPTRSFSINAATLSVIGIAVKLAVDQRSPMPSRMDQLAKLSGSAFISIVLASSLPSLGQWDREKLRQNTMAVGALILTSVFSIVFQLDSRVIHAYRIAHGFMIFIIIFLLFLYFLTFRYTTILEDNLLGRFHKLHQRALKESFSDSDENIKESMKMEDYLLKFSMLAQSSCPQFMLSRSRICMTAAFSGLMAASALFFVLLATITHKDKMVGLNTCSGESRYGWSVFVILITQAIAVVVGLVAPLSRTIYDIEATRRKGPTSPPRNDDSSEVKQFSMQLLRKIVFSKIVYLKKVSRKLFKFITHRVPEIEMARTRSNHYNQNSNDLKLYFIYWKREADIIDFMVKSSSRVTQRYIDAEKREPKHLIAFLKKHLTSHDFGGVLSFESDGVPLLSGFDEHPPKCWSLLVVTLTCIATALPKIDHTCRERLRKSVEEGLIYVNLVENILEDRYDLYNARRAAALVRSYLPCRWFNINLKNLARNSKCPREVLSRLANSAKGRSSKFLRQQKYDPDTQSGSNFVVVAAHSMYSICEAILPDRQCQCPCQCQCQCQNEDNIDPSSDEIYKKLCITIADILGACFTNLRQYILRRCGKSPLGKNRETAFRMLNLFGKTKKIMQILEEKDRKIPKLSDDKMLLIDEWRSYLKCQRTEEQTRTEGNPLNAV